MGMRVLALTDGSAAAQGALAWAATLSAATGSELSVATAWQPEYSEMDQATYAEHLEAARRELEDDWCAILHATDIPYQAVVLEGDPRQVVPAWAAEHDTDLVVLGPHGRGLDRRHGGYIGSVTTFLAHNLRRPLVSVPAGPGTDLPEHIVVGVDGSPASLAAVEWCATLAPLLHADVIAVFAETPFAEWIPRSDPKSWYQRAQRSLQEWTTPLRAPSVASETRIVEHQGGRALLELANNGTTDLLVVGKRGQGGFTDLLLGSTALKLLHHSSVPVVLVPAETDRQD
jgi:nucleotide-binding universal stress UspA family protein